MEPGIQYAKTEDGVSIAYTTAGEGTPLVRTARLGLSNIQLETLHPDVQRWLDSLNHRLVSYDPRNAGLSSKSEDYSLEAHVRDLDAVVDAIELDRFALYGSRNSGPIAIKYAATHRDRVSRLVLFCASPYGTVRDGDLSDPMRKLARDDWNTYTRATASDFFAFGAGDFLKEFVRDWQQNFTPDEWLAIQDAIAELDATPYLERVECPTLVIQRREVQAPPLDVAQLLAARIPDAHLVLHEGDSAVPFVGDLASLANAINDFLADGQEATPPAMSATSDGAAVHTILFTDMESSTTLTQQLGDAGAQEVRRSHNDIVRSALAANGGSEIKHTGDGIMASFATASGALECAIAIQRGVAAHKDQHSDSPLGVYVGLNAGEPIAEEGPDGRVDLFGTSINLAARICDHAEAGQIVASNVVRELAAGKEFLFSDLGETELRGFEDPVKLWELRWQEQE